MEPVVNGLFFLLIFELLSSNSITICSEATDNNINFFVIYFHLISYCFYKLLLFGLFFSCSVIIWYWYLAHDFLCFLQLCWTSFTLPWLRRLLHPTLTGLYLPPAYLIIYPVPILHTLLLDCLISLLLDP